MAALSAIAMKTPGMRLMAHHSGSRVVIHHQVRDRAHSSVGCAVHDAHNALRCGHQMALGQNEEVMRTVYAATSSLNPFQDFYQFYTCLGLPHDAVDTLTSLRCVFKPEEGIFHLDAAACAGRDWVADFSSALLSTYLFTVFTESGWLTVGASCRAVVASRTLEYFELVQHMRHTRVISEYTIAGFNKLDTDSMRFILVVALSSYLPE
eukprot:4604272-Amphidinium_carterae.1